MPKIPLVNRPNVRQHQDNAVHLQGAPGLNWNVERSGIGEAIIEGAERVGKAFMGMQSALQETEDKTQFNELQLLETEQNGSVEKYFRENSAEYRNFPEYLKSAEDTATERRGTILDKMSPAARRNGEQFVAQNRLSRQQFMGKAEYQAHVTTQIKTLEQQIVHNAKLGRREQALNCIAVHEVSDGKFPPLLTANMADKYRDKVNELGDHYDAEKLIDTGDISVLSRLQNRDENGNFTDFTSLSPDGRRQLVRYGEQKNNRREVENDQRVLAAFAKGDMAYSDNDLESLHQRGLISDRQFHTYKNWNKSFEDKEKKAADYQANQQEKMQKAARQQQFNKLISDVGYDENGYARQLEPATFTQAYDKMKKICGNDYGLFDNGMKQLNAMKEKDVKYRDTPIYRDGDIYLASMKAQGRFAARNGRDKRSSVVGLIERTARMDLENFVKDHPNSSILEVQNFLDNRITLYNKNTVEEIGNMAMNSIAVRRGKENLQKRVGNSPREGQTGTFNSKKVIFKNGKWEYAD